MIKKFEINYIKKKAIYEKWVLCKIVNINCGLIYAITFNYFQKIFATGSSDNSVCIYCLKSHKKLANFLGHNGAVQTIFLEERQKSIFSGGEDHVIKQWDLEYNKIIRNYNGHINTIIKVTKHPNLNVLFSSSKDSTIRLWDLRIRKEVQILNGHNNSVTCLLSFSESPHIISGSLDNTIRFWDLVADKNALVLKSYQNGIKEMQYIGKNGEFSSLSSDSLNFYRKDGLLLNRIINLKNSYNSFCLRKNTMAIGYRTGWIKYFYSNNSKSSIYFKFFDKKFIEKNYENNIKISFNQLENQIYAIGFLNRIKIFSKRLFYKNINKNNYDK